MTNAELGSGLKITNNSPSFDRLEDDYPEALIRIATLRAKPRQHLLFGWVELYPFDTRAPSGWTAGAKPWSVPGKQGWSCGFSAKRVSTRAAMQWYADAAAGKVSFALDLPTPMFAGAPPQRPEPRWGSFAAGTDAPFSWHWHDGPRIHRLVPMRRPSRDVHELAAIEPARLWLRTHLSFDPFDREDWLCGLALLAPDPICASFRVSRSARTDEGETLSVQAVPRRMPSRSADLTTLTAHVFERRVGSWASFTSIPIDSTGFAAVRLPQPTDQIGWAVVCKDRGLLRVHDPCPWADQINLEMEHSGGTVEVEVPAGGRRKPPQKYQSPLRSVGHSTVIGGPVDDAARKRLQRLYARRRRREDLAAAPQRLFGVVPSASTPSIAEVDRNRKEAQDFIVALIEKARKRLIFVDPYFGPRELRLLAFRNMRAGVVPRVLTGLPGLRVLSGTTQGFQVQQGCVLAADLKHISQQLGDRVPIIRVMPGGDQPVIHDRFLVVDDEAWFCGPSLNEFGERLGVIARLPDPMKIRVAIAKTWLWSEPFTDVIPAPAPNS